MHVDDTTIIRRSITGRSFSSAVTAITVAVGVALVLILLSMRSAGERAFQRGTGNMHMLITQDAGELASVLNSIFYASAPNASIPRERFDALTAEYPFAFAIPTTLGDSYRGSPVVGTTPDYFTEFRPAPSQSWSLKTGAAFPKGTDAEGDELFQAVVGADASTLHGLRVGDRITITHGLSRNDPNAHEHDEFTFTVVGILNPSATPHDRAIFIPIAASWVVHAQDRLYVEIGPEAPIATPDDLQPIDTQITGVYARVLTRGGTNDSAGLTGGALQVYEAIRRGREFTIAYPPYEVAGLFNIVGNINAILVGLALAVLVSSGVTLMLAMYNTMEQRRRQIAVLRVLGCTRARVFALVITEAAVLGFLGALLGVAVSFIGVRVVAAALQQATGVVVRPDLALRWTMLTILITVVLASIAGLIPALTAYRTSVVRNLRPIG